MELAKVRVGDAERSATIDQITEQHALGRLDPTEADVRVTAALNAQTVGDLHRLTSDLPRPATPAVRAGQRRWWHQHGARTSFAAFCLLGGATATTAATDSLFVGGISLLAGTCGVVLGRFSTPDS